MEEFTALLDSEGLLRDHHKQLADDGTSGLIADMCVKFVPPFDGQLVDLAKWLGISPDSFDERQTELKGKLVVSL